MKCQYCRKKAETTVNNIPVCKKHFFTAPAKSVDKSTENFIESMVEIERNKGKVGGLD